MTLTLIWRANSSPVPEGQGTYKRAPLGVVGDTCITSCVTAALHCQASCQAPQRSRKHSRTHTHCHLLHECFTSMADEIKEQESCKGAHFSVSLEPCQVSFSSSQHLPHQPEPSPAWLPTGTFLLMDFRCSSKAWSKSTGNAPPPSHPCPS